ncbi:MAG: GGDEF domain-containing protein [Deltaproteobacteria bacterium]|nr:GGDEF domain-containing protein [Deltaproteobacteria bacterium]
MRTTASHLDAQTRITSVRDLTSLGQSRDAFLVMVRGPEIGRRIQVTDSVVTIGRDPESTIALKSDSVSRYHARIEPTEQGYRLVDNMSTNGTYRNQAQVHGSTMLTSGDYIHVGDSIFKFLAGDNIEAAFHEEIYRLTIEDSLTQVANKRALLDFLDKEFARAKRYQRDLSVIMLDLDFFKKVNDTYGHLMGDFVLREFAKLVSSRIRREELFARYGGEEFCIVVPEMNREKAVSFAEALRALIEEHTFAFEGTSLKMTCSLGVATVAEAMTRVEDLLSAADENLYKAKNEGRNRVVG